MCQGSQSYIQQRVNFTVCKLGLSKNVFLKYMPMIKKLDFRESSAGKESACKAGEPRCKDPLEKGQASHSSILGPPLQLSW